MTTEKIPLIEKDIQNMSESIKELKSEMKSHREDMNAHREEFQQFKDELFTKLDTRFAGKWVEKALLTGAGIVATVIIGALLKLILK